MNLLLDGIGAFWDSFYYTCFQNIDFRLKSTIGCALLLVFLICFIQSTKGKKKAELINNWFWFWISMIAFIVGVLYLS